MKFKWDEETELMKGDSPTPRGFLNFVQDNPSIFFVMSIGLFVLVAAYGGKAAIWVIHHVVG